MLLWIKLFWDICRLQKGPQDVPYSQVMLWLLLVLGFALDCFMLYIREADTDFGTILLAILSLTVISLLIVVVLMYLMKLTQRINQTLVSLFGTGLLIGFIALPFYSMIYLQDEVPAMPVLVLLILEIWSFIVTTYILKHALMVNYFIAGILVVGFFVLGSEVLELFFPPQAESVIPEGIRVD